MSEQPEFPKIELDWREPASPKKVVPNPDLPSPYETPEALEILAMARGFAKDSDQAVAAYCADPETWGGAYVSGDELLRMLPGTAINPHLSYAICGGIVADLPRRIFKARLALPALPGERVLLTMGMPATGKTTLVKGGLGKLFHTVMDTPLGSHDFAREMVQEIQASGRQASLVLAWRPLHLAIPGMLDRALPSQEARVVTLMDMAELLINVLRSFRLFAEMNRHDVGTTLDLVEIIDGRRVWRSGSEAVHRVATIQQHLQTEGPSVLIQIATQWKRALALAGSQGISLVPLIRTIAEDGLDLSKVPIAPEEIPWSDFLPPVQEYPSSLQSLGDHPAWANRLPKLILGAERYEANLRRSSPFRWVV